GSRGTERLALEDVRIWQATGSRCEPTSGTIRKLSALCPQFVRKVSTTCPQDVAWSELCIGHGRSQTPLQRTEHWTDTRRKRSMRQLELRAGPRIYSTLAGS